MKKRLGFVSNSSSSSFTCDVCGREESGYDAGYSDFEMFECINGHVVCEDHALCELTCDENDEDDYSSYDVVEKCCPICSFIEFSYSDAANYLFKKYKIERSKVLSIIQEVNQKRDHLYDEEYVNYVFKEKNLTDNSFLEAIKSEFKTYSDYTSWKPQENK